jgi:pre-mRNA-splicing factor CDC5/CEF1
LRLVSFLFLQVHERHDLPAHVKHTNDMNDTQFSHKRSKLLMPAPQVSERELEDLAKMGQAGVLAAAEAAAAVGSSGVTGALLNDYATPRVGASTLRTPMRTPAAGGDSVLQVSRVNCTQVAFRCPKQQRWSTGAQSDFLW